jgi:hypothetical protein
VKAAAPSSKAKKTAAPTVSKLEKTVKKEVSKSAAPKATTLS